MEDLTFSGNTLTLRAFHDLQGFFESKDHHPSGEMLEGLYNLIDNLTQQLTGNLKQKYYVSSLDPGVGKTSAIKAWLSNFLRRSKEHEGKGIILCFDRHEEIISFLDDCQLPESAYGVLVGNSTEKGKLLNSRGVGLDHIQNAIILFTTKSQIIIKTLKEIPFENVNMFRYLGNPRVVRIWDESMIVGRPLTINASQILELVNTVERVDTETARLLRILGNSLYECSDKDIIPIPDFEIELKYGFRWSTSGMRKTAETLDLLSGRVAEVRVEGKGRVVLDCIESLPSDFKPCLVADASARFRKTYDLYQEYNGDVVMLSPEHSCKRFDPLTVSILNRSTSKETFSRLDELQKVAKDVAHVVMSRPLEMFLIVVTVDNFKRMARAIREELPATERHRTEFLTWGRHTATNEFVEIPNVIITSLLYYRTSDYIAGMRASAVYPVSRGLMPPEKLQDFKSGEIGHHVMQVGNRGKMRKCVGNTCPPSRLWIMAAKASGIEGIIEEVFRGCSVDEWVSVNPVEVSGIKRQVADYILRELSEGRDSLAVGAIRNHFGFKGVSNFRKTYLEDSVFMDHCGSHGILYIDEKGSRPKFELNPFI